MGINNLSGRNVIYPGASLKFELYIQGDGYYDKDSVFWGVENSEGTAWVHENDYFKISNGVLTAKSAASKLTEPSMERVYGRIVVAASVDSFETIGFLPPNIRLTVMDTVGFVSFDSYESADSLSNHLMRPEVKDCMSGMEGYSIRQSESSDKKFFYYAKRYDDLIVRLALPYEVDVRNFFRPNWLVISLLTILFAMLTMPHS